MKRHASVVDETDVCLIETPIDSRGDQLLEFAFVVCLRIARICAKIDVESRLWGEVKEVVLVLFISEPEDFDLRKPVGFDLLRIDEPNRALSNLDDVPIVEQFRFDLGIIEVRAIARTQIADAPPDVGRFDDAVAAGGEIVLKRDGVLSVTPKGDGVTLQFEALTPLGGLNLKIWHWVGPGNTVCKGGQEQGLQLY